MALSHSQYYADDASLWSSWHCYQETCITHWFIEEIVVKFVDIFLQKISSWLKCFHFEPVVLHLASCLSKVQMTSHHWLMTAITPKSLLLIGLNWWSPSISKLNVIGWDNGLSPGRRQAIMWTSAGILLIGPLETNVSEILIAIETFSFKKMCLKMSAKWCPFRLASMS